MISIEEKLSSIIPQTMFDASIESKFSVSLYHCFEQEKSNYINQLKK